MPGVDSSDRSGLSSTSDAVVTRRRSRVLTRRGWALLGALAGLYIGSLILGTVELAILAIAGGVLVLIAVWWARSRRIDLAARRVVRPARLHVGADGRVDLAIVNRGHRATPLLSVTDLFDDGRRAARFLVPPVPPGETAQAAYRIPTTHRGRYRIGPLAVAVTDPFGLARRSWMAARSSEVIVHPRVHDILAPSQAGGRLAASIETVQASAQAVDGEEFLTLREYEVGDDLRRVHWRSTARTGELMIRQDEAQWRARAVVVFDTRENAHDAASFEIAIEAVASISERLARMRRRVEVITSAGESLGSGDHLLDRLAVIKPGGADRLAGVLTSLRAHRSTGFVVGVFGRVSPSERGALRSLTAQAAVVLVATRPFEAAEDAAARSSARRGVVIVDAHQHAFPTAWNEAVTRWRPSAAPSSPHLPSPR